MRYGGTYIALALAASLGPTPTTDAECMRQRQRGVARLDLETFRCTTQPLARRQDASLTDIVRLSQRRSRQRASGRR